MLVLMMAGMLGCADKGGSCDAEALDAGGAAAVVDSAAGGATDWSDDAVTWTWAGASLQINSTASGGWLLSLVAQTDQSGADLGAAAAAGEYPIQVDLFDGGFAVMYPDDGDSYASNKGGGGSLEILEIGDEQVLGCFDFDAATAGGESLTVSQGAFRATPL